MDQKYTKFTQSFKSGLEVYLEDSLLWYALDMDAAHYCSLNIHDRINLKQSYIVLAA
jgi:hypothetical protein